MDLIKLWWFFFFPRKRAIPVMKVPNGTILRFNGDIGLHNGPLIIEVEGIEDENE